MKLNLSMLFLFAAVCLSAQPKLAFDKTQHDFGKVSEGAGAAVYDFTFRNTGTAPVIIQNVTTTCGCTTPEYTKQPIIPGAAGFIRVSYDVKGRPGAIDKTITVYSNSGSSPDNLRIVGEVTPVERHPESFRYTAGTVRLDNMHVSFNRVYSYEKPALMVTAYNPGPDAVKISFINLPAHIKAEVTPATVRKGERANIKVTYDAARKGEWDFVTDQISMILNDDRSKDYKLTVTATIEEDFTRWTAAQMQAAPSVSVDRPVIEAGKIRKGESKMFQVKLTNSGKGKLYIRKAESTSPQVKIAAPAEINAGASADLNIAYTGSGQNGPQNRSVTVITNDPRNSRVTIRLNADVTE